jgi:cytochrome c biogenesis protein
MDNKSKLRQHPIIVFLGSMNLAVTLLVMLAIASVIGTVLKQNEAYASYVIKFGPFWFEVFRNLELYDVYSAIWFLSVLAFLLASISACVWRNGGHFVRDMLSFQEHQHSTQLKKSKLSSEWHSALSPSEVLVHAQAGLTQSGFKVKVKQDEKQTLLAAKRGSLHRMGYFFTHIAIIVICFGALLDSNLKFKFREWAGYVEAETRSLALTEVNPKANIDADNFAFRGSVNIPEGKRADVVFLTFKEGYLVQKLPFQIQVVDFRVAHYDTGMPKSFESDIMVIDPELPEPIKATLSVNKPLIYKDYAIYQSSFGDGGSGLKLNAWALVSQEIAPVSLSGEIHAPVSIDTPLGAFKIELDDYKSNNVIPLPDNDPSGKKHKNIGPSVQFKVRDTAGQAVEYENYLTAIERNGRWYQASKYRKSRAEPFEFLMIPLDDQMSLTGFMQLLSRINDRNALDAALDATIAQEKDATNRDQLMMQKRFMQQLINLFRLRINHCLQRSWMSFP